MVAYRGMEKATCAIFDPVEAMEGALEVALEAGGVVIWGMGGEGGRRPSLSGAIEERGRSHGWVARQWGEGEWT